MSRKSKTKNFRSIKKTPQLTRKMSVSSPTAVEVMKTCGLFPEEYQQKAVMSALSRLDMLNEKNISFQTSTESNSHYYIVGGTAPPVYLYRIHVCTSNICTDNTVLKLHRADNILIDTECLDSMHVAINKHNLTIGTNKFKIDNSTVCDYDGRTDTYYFRQIRPPVSSEIIFGEAKFAVMHGESDVSFWPYTTKMDEFEKQARFAAGFLSCGYMDLRKPVSGHDSWLDRLHLLHLMFKNPDVIPSINASSRHGIAEVKRISDTRFDIVYLCHIDGDYNEYVITGDKIDFVQRGLPPVIVKSKFDQFPHRDDVVKDYISFLEKKLDIRIKEAREKNQPKIVVAASEHFNSQPVIEWLKELCADRRYKFSYKGKGYRVFIRLLG